MMVNVDLIAVQDVLYGFGYDWDAIVCLTTRFTARVAGRS